MENKVRGQGLERVLKKLRTSIDKGNYYEAHQMYRTLYFRYLNQNKYTDVLELLYDGATLFLKHNQLTSGSDLAYLLVDVLVKSGAGVTEENIEMLGQLYSLMEAESVERSSFLNAAIRWSTQQNNHGESYIRGHPRLHQLIALALWKEKNYPQARYHFIRSTDGSNCATMLVEYHVSKGYPSEVDLFIAQAVFQYLCLKNAPTANIVFYAYTKQHPSVHCGPPFLLPLLNFIWFLLTALEQGKLTVFTVLCEQYQPSITRDPMYHEYLDKIGQLFFGLPPPPKQQGGLIGNLIQSLMGSMDDGEVESNPGPSVRLQPVQHEELD